MEINKAVIPVAGLGTRLLPTTKAIPKEMLPLGRYPIIQHAVEELIQAVEEERDVIACSSGRDARAALEMIMAVHESQCLGTRVAFPLENRENPYEVWRREQE